MVKMLLETIQQNLKQAMLSRVEVKVATLRLLISEIRNAQIAKGHELTDEEIIDVIIKEVKKRKEAAVGFRQGNREEQALKEESELQILEEYLPDQMNDEELTNVVKTTITELGASGIGDMGKVIGAVMGKVKGKAAGERVSLIAKGILSK